MSSVMDSTAIWALRLFYHPIIEYRIRLVRMVIAPITMIDTTVMMITAIRLLPVLCFCDICICINMWVGFDVSWILRLRLRRLGGSADRRIGGQAEYLTSPHPDRHGIILRPLCRSTSLLLVAYLKSNCDGDELLTIDRWFVYELDVFHLRCR